MSIERNKAIVRRLFDEVWNAGKLDAALVRGPCREGSRPCARIWPLRQIFLRSAGTKGT